MQFLLLPSATHIYIRAFPHPDHIFICQRNCKIWWERYNRSDCVQQCRAFYWMVNRARARNYFFLSVFWGSESSGDERSLSTDSQGSHECRQQRAWWLWEGNWKTLWVARKWPHHHHTTTTPPPSPPLHWPTGVVCSHIGKSSHSDPLEVFTVHTLKIPHTACWVIASKVSTHREGRAVATPRVSMCFNPQNCLRVHSSAKYLCVSLEPSEPLWRRILTNMGIVASPDGLPSWLGKSLQVKWCFSDNLCFLATLVTVALKSKPSPY